MPRSPNLDLIRAFAILMVLMHHVGQNLLSLPIWLREYTALGAYGVDLFFVLSGWLIGSLYWREEKKYGVVAIKRFWVRRWMRTIPPYLVVLPIAYLGVYLLRGQTFDWAYLLFLQNYRQEMPFFLLSWSLSVEEHFYLIMPLAILFLRSSKLPINIIMPLAIFLAGFARVLDPLAIPAQPFGYPQTATHLNVTGLLLGFWLSYLSIYSPKIWAHLVALSSKCVVILLLAILAIPLLPEGIKYYFGSTFIAIAFSLGLVYLNERKPLALAKTKAIFLISISSYSTYLTHGLVLHGCLYLSAYLGIPAETVFPIWFCIMLSIGYMMYLIIESPLLLLREKVMPR